MNRRSKAVPDATGADPARMLDAARALQRLHPSRENMNAMLSMACEGVDALAATLWERDAGRAWRVSCRAPDETGQQDAVPIATDELPAPLLEPDTLTVLSAAAAHALRPTPPTRTLAVLPVGRSPTALLCVEFAPAFRTPPAETELLLRLLVTRLEAALQGKAAADNADPRREAHVVLRESHLALSDDSLRDLFFLAPTAMLLADIAEATPLAANRHALALFGLSSERTDDILASDFWEDVAERRRFVQLAVEKGSVREYRARLRRADGKPFWGLVSANVIDYNGRPALMSSVVDVTGAVAAEEILNRTQKTLMTLLEASPYPLIVTRLDTGVIRFCNRKAADMFETPLSGLLGHTAPEFYVDPSDRTYFVEKLQSVGKIEGFVAKLKTRSGQPFWAMLSARTLELNGEPVFMVAFADVTRQKHKEEELEHLAFKDALTNAYNRRYFVEAARMELVRAERGARPPAIALIDIDHFKRLNDTHGHDVGDRVLREFVAQVQGMLRKSDILARYGGEEFAILFPETELDVACGIVERVRRAIARHRFSANGETGSVTFSAGVTAARAGDDCPSLVARADDLLYAAKRAGRNRVETGAN